MVQNVEQPEFVGRLEDALRRELGRVGVHAEVYHGPVPPTKLVRFLVLAPQFESIPPSERQDLVWRMAGSVLTQEEQLSISMILAVPPEPAQDQPRPGC